MMLQVPIDKSVGIAAACEYCPASPYAKVLSLTSRYFPLVTQSQHQALVLFSMSIQFRIVQKSFFFLTSVMQCLLYYNI